MDQKPVYPFVLAIYGQRDDAQSVGEFSRPQDFGDPERWHYHYIEVNQDQPFPAIFQAHLWLEYELRRSDDLLEDELFNLAVQVVLAGVPNNNLDPQGPPPMSPTDCFQEDDFWEDEWGERPPWCEE